METAVRWSPSSTLSEQRFLIVDVKDRSFKRCKVSQYNGKSFKHETLSTYSTVPGFRAFDWAPQNENLVAVGSWSGEVSILHIDDSLPNISLPAKRQRLCNAVAFSRTGLLAAGLEGVRNDFCLNLWDVNQRPPTVSSSGGGSSKPFVEPYRRFASSEAISSIKFFTSQPDVFVAGIKGKGVRIYDLRENSGNPSLIFKTDCVFNIAIDPLDENYFACAGHPEDRTIQIWDSRRGTPYSAAMTGSSSDLGAQVEKPVLEYRDVFRPQKGSLKKFDGTGVMISTIWSLRYCKGKSGCLGVLASTGNFKVYETKHGYSPATEHKIPEQPDHEVTSNNDHAMLTKRIHQIEHACDDIRHGRPEKERIVAFDFTNLASKKGTPSVIILGGDHTVNIIELDGAPSSLGVSSLGDLVVTKPHQSNSRLRSRTDEDYFLDNALQMFAPREEGNIADSTVQVRQNQTDTTSQDSGAKIVAQNISLSSHELLEKLLGDQTSGARLRLEDGLAISTITRRRCLEGYLFNCKRNREIMHEEPRLQRLWSWIDRSKSANDKESMATDTLDLSFFGVASIWNNDLDSQRASNRSSKPTYSKEVAIAVETLCDRLHLPEFRMTESAVPNHRRLCLYTCGLGLSLATLDILVNDLVRQGQNTKAAVLGIIHDQVGLAFQALRNGNTSPANRELSLALAAYNKGTTNALWQETTRELGNGLDDPYARAILTFVRSGDWHDVLAESSLPLRDTVGIALMYLDDTELTQYINSKLAASIKNGNIDGIVLTGLTEQAVRLFETYIRKYSDLQTAVLAMSFTCPRYFTDLRVDLWRETYRSYLNNWGKLYERAHFDVQSATLCTAPNQKPELRIMPRQLTLLCNYCDQSLDCNSINAPPPTAPTTHGTHPEKIFGNDKTDTVCPTCGRHMQRCAICMQWLGMSHQNSQLRAATEMTQRNTAQRFIDVCQACGHMSHSDHADLWFARNKLCPVPDCQCMCKGLDFGRG